MSYIADETSEQEGAPVELYEFARVSVVDAGSNGCGNDTSRLVIYRYTSAESAFVLSSQTFLSESINRSAIEATPEMPRNNLTLTTRRGLPVADLFRVFPPSDVITVTVKRVHRGSPTDAAIIWTGRVLGVSFNGAMAQISCEPVSTSLRRTGLRRLYQAQCPHVLYGPACKVDRATHAQATAVVGISGLELTVGALADKPYAGGFVDWEVGADIFERRFIKSFTGSVLTLSQPFQGIAITDAVTVYPGCDHTMGTCNDDFANIENYGGFPFIPFKNPFGTSVF